MNAMCRAPSTLIACAAVITSLSLSGCTDLDTASAPPPDSSPTSSPAAEGPSDDTRFADMDARVAATYPVRESTGTFTGDQNGVLTLRPPGDPATTKVVMMLTCTGSGTYWIDVEQAKPNRVGATCGDSGTSIAAVPLDDPTASTTLDVRIPNGSRYWLTTYYTTK